VRRQALVLGAGGHCRVLLSLLAACGEQEVLGIVDLTEPRVGEVIMGVPVIGSITCLEAFRRRADLDVFLAIGDNALRRIWWQKVGDLGLALPNLISPHAIVDPHAHLGDANVVCARAFIGPEVVLGDNNLVNTAAVLEHEVRVGCHCHLASSSTVAGRSQIGDGCFVGAGATVINNVEVAADTTIGAGATVVRSLSNPGVYVGIPARRAGF
jgi:sugar O-acyltransferase (sialic acid O-acetyltransferase NeuD family)